MPTLLTSLLILLLCFLSGSESSPESELQILMQLKNFLEITNSTSGFQSWNSPSASPCDFTGISCNTASSVIKIDLSHGGFSRNVPFFLLCQLPSLTNLNLTSNYFYGITSDNSSCTELTSLDLSYNIFTGPIPDLFPLNKLQYLFLSDNLFSGVFPWTSLRNLTSLTSLDLSYNNFTGPLPDLFPLNKLQYLFLSDNVFFGVFPWTSLRNLTSLTSLSLGDNSFDPSPFPEEVTELANLTTLFLSVSNLYGEIPRSIGNLTELTDLQLSGNSLSGVIPREITKMKKLSTLELYGNWLTGTFPPGFGNLTELASLDFSNNSMKGDISELRFLNKLQSLQLFYNQFSGEVPPEFGKCTSLTRLRVNKNRLSGAVPTGIWSLPNLDILNLADNNFDGPIDAGIGKAKSLDYMYLAGNRFSGEIPTEIGSASSLVYMDLSLNWFSGPIPVSIGNCVSLTAINLACNKFTGDIPASLGHLQGLNSLILANNQFSGEIPTSLSSLKLSSLDLSNNKLTGTVSTDLSVYAYNGNFSGNPDLCSDFISYLKPCTSSSSSDSSKLRIVLACLLVPFVLLLCSVGLFLLTKCRRSDRNAKNSPSWELRPFRVLSFDEQEIVKSISRENVIGKGGSGNVYRVSLGTGTTVAVKHILHPSADATTAKSTAAMLPTRRPAAARSLFREFEAEVNTLSSIRHVNVVKLYCSITSEDSSLLVYEYLPNGSLWDRIHSAAAAGEEVGLHWETRYEIAVGAARGLEYLHHGCGRTIMHRDVKSSNILLDEFFKPRIADFGLAKILQSGLAGKDSSSTTHVIAGTHGYIAPEYAYTSKVNEKSDVYSFGVVLMELVTGRRPIEEEYGEGKDIVYWVTRSTTRNRDRIVAMVDPSIQEDSAIEEAVRVLKVGVLCTARLPSTRPSMRTVVHMLEDARGK